METVVGGAYAEDGPGYSFLLPSSLPDTLIGEVQKLLALGLSQTGMATQAFSLTPPMAEFLSKDRGFWAELLEATHGVELELRQSEAVVKSHATEEGLMSAMQVVSIIQAFEESFSRVGSFGADEESQSSAFARREFMATVRQTDLLSMPTYEAVPSSVLSQLVSLFKDYKEKMLALGKGSLSQAVLSKTAFGCTPASPRTNRKRKERDSCTAITQNHSQSSSRSSTASSEEAIVTDDGMRIDAALPIPVSVSKPKSQSKARREPLKGTNGLTPPHLPSTSTSTSRPPSIGNGRMDTTPAPSTWSAANRRVVESDRWAGWRKGDAVLRPAKLDVCNVGYLHGKNKFISCRGVLLTMKALIEQGHKVTAYLPGSYKPPRGHAPKYRPPNPIADQEVLSHLFQLDLLVFTPTGEMATGNGQFQKYTHYDDLYIVQNAACDAALIISCDNFRDVKKKHPEYINAIETGLLKPCFEGNRLTWPLDGPGGRFRKQNLADAIQFLPNQPKYNTVSRNQLSVVDQSKALHEIYLLLSLCNGDPNKPWGGKEKRLLRQRSIVYSTNPNHSPPHIQAFFGNLAGFGKRTHCPTPLPKATKRSRSE